MKIFDDFIIRVATKAQLNYCQDIVNEIDETAKAKGTGIARRTVEYITSKINEGKGIIATHKDGTWAGFCYIETWGHGKFVANSGLIVAPKYRKTGLATAIKQQAFVLSRQKFPDAKLFGLTTGLAVMKINSILGYIPVTYSELTDDKEFWKGCQSCENYSILTSKEFKNCLCTAMLYDPKVKEQTNSKAKKFDLFTFIKESIKLKKVG
jgi:hypothetical protein